MRVANCHNSTNNILFIVESLVFCPKKGWEFHLGSQLGTDKMAVRVCDVHN
jgi:hypothetical protein